MSPARIKNKQVEEQRLQDLLKKATGKLSEILQVEKELSRVRGEIEQLQGRIRVLANLSSLTTITLTMREIKDYVPPRAADLWNANRATVSGFSGNHARRGQRPNFVRGWLGALAADFGAVWNSAVAILETGESEKLV